MVASPDVEIFASLRSFLLSDAEINTFVGGTDIYVGDLPEKIVQGQSDNKFPRKMIVIKAAGGIPQSDLLEISRQRIDIMVYGETLFDAEALRLHVSTLFRTAIRKVQSNVLIHRVDESNQPIDARDPDLDWPLKIQSFEVLASRLATP